LIHPKNKKELSRKTPASISNFMVKAEEFINADETIKAFTEQADWVDRLDQRRKDQPCVDKGICP
jgi:lysyl-tRNA synthetase class II